MPERSGDNAKSSVSLSIVLFGYMVYYFSDFHSGKGRSKMKKYLFLSVVWLVSATAIFGQSYSLGDVNHSGVIDIVDALVVAQFYVGLNPASYNAAQADVNASGNVDIVDALLIAQYYVGLISQFPGQTKFTLTISVSGSGSTNPSAGSYSYNSGSSVTVTATAGSGYTFSGWSGAASGTANPVTIVMNGNKSLTAGFTSSGGPELYVAPNGVAGAAGTIGAPTTLADAISKIAASGTIWMRGGTYNYSSTIVIAEGNNGKKIFAYQSEIPVLDFSAQSFDSSNRGIILAGSNWYIKGITIQKAGDNGMLLAGDGNTLENCKFLGNRDSGLQLSRYNSSYTSISQWPSNNTMINCLSQDNYDPDNGEDADGYSPKLTCGTGNVFKGCKSLYNTDDGFDCYTKSDTGAIGAIRFEDCEASNNGQTSTGQSGAGSDGNGFKLGDDTAAVSHVLVNCVANNNKKNGFTGNGNPGPITLTNCTGSGNGGSLFDRL
jgi:uncharacterized repeat protein (TIGR02543 family)